MIVVLTLITALVGALLGGVYQLTAEPIALANARAQQEAIREVAPEFDNDPIAESDTIVSNGLQIVVFPAKMSGETTGAAVKAPTKAGFNGEIVVMVGFEKDGTIREYRVLSHSETPGLGAKMDEWFRTDKNRQNILGKNPATVNLTVTKDGGEIDAITASTITSRAFLQAIQTAYAAYMQESVDSVSGSTPQKKSDSDHAAQTTTTQNVEPTTTDRR